MITRPLAVSGCAVIDCAEEVAGVIEVQANVTPALSFGMSGGFRRMQVPLCAGHLEEMVETRAHPPGQIHYHAVNFYRAIRVVEAPLQVER